MAELGDPRMTTLRLGATTVAFLSGVLALVALAVGSPLQFGVALASCGAGWIAADFIRWTVEYERAARRCAVPVARLSPGYPSSHVVYIGGGACSSHATHRSESALAA